MDIDFHFGTVYVLARWAGFSSKNAKVIAASSQFVDDNISGDPFLMATASRMTEDGRTIRYSGHELWENLLDDGNEQVWIPYHFLPGLQGESEEDKLICKKNSTLAISLAERLAQITLDNPNYAFELGIGLHVYADTWAHQEFSGIITAKNIILGLVYKQFGEGVWEDFMESVESLSCNATTKPLGHAAALHWPDRPYAEWKSATKFEAGRYNWMEFLEASRAIYKILAKVNGSNVAENLSEEQEDALQDTFKGVYMEDEGMRNEEWIKRIRENHFDFVDYCEDDANLDYTKYFILSDEDYPRQFYESLDNYYHWVKNKLEEAGIYRLQ